MKQTQELHTGMHPSIQANHLPGEADWLPWSCLGRQGWGLVCSCSSLLHSLCTPQLGETAACGCHRECWCGMEYSSSW